jgi:hypothetical protein
VNQDFPKRFQFNLSGAGCWLTLLAIGLLLGAVGLGWVVNGFLIIVGLVIISPIIGFNRTDCQCPNCAEPLKVEQGHFQRLTPPGTIDVEAVEVSVRQIED